MIEIARYREALVKRFIERMQIGDFVAQRRGFALGGLPCTETDGALKSLSHVNALIAMQVLSDRGLTDPRVFTVEQAQKSGWRLKDGATGILMQFQSPGTGEVKRFRVYPAADFDGPAPWVGRIARRSDDLAMAIGAGIGQLGAGLDGWVERAGHRGEAGLLRRQLLGLWLETAGDMHGLVAPLEHVQWSAIAKWLEADLDRLHAAVGDVELMHADIDSRIRAVEFERGTSGPTPKSGVSGGNRRDDMSTGSNLERIRVLYESRQTVLAVPYAQKDKAHELGAVWHPEHKIWFVPAGADASLFKEWELGGGLSQVATDAMILDDFAQAMRDLNLVVPKEINADGKWHSIKVDNGKSNNAGSYMLVIHGVATPYGRLSNKISGIRVDWIYEGEALTPEQRKRLMEQARAHEEAARKEERVRHDAVAVKAAEIFSKGISPDGHGYARKKGVGVGGLRQISGAELLKYDEFHGETGKSVIRPNQMYLLVPLQNEQGQIRNLQAISPDGKFKSFMRGAQKSGLMHVLGAPSFDAVLQGNPNIVSFCEGYATGYDFRCGMAAPTVICFDAGNLETMAKRLAPRLPKETIKVIAIDNDQYHVEKALEHLAGKVGVNPHSGGGASVSVLSRYGVCALYDGALRSVSLGDVVADGEWHQAPRGKYCVRLTHESDSAAVRSLQVDVVVEGRDGRQDHYVQVFNNRGAEAGKVARNAAENCYVAAPSFRTLDGRPTDWNDLMKAEGLDVVKEQMGQIENAMFNDWFKDMQQAHHTGPGIDDAPVVPPPALAVSR